MKAVKKNKTNNRKMITFQQEDHTLKIEMNREIGNTDLSLWVEDDNIPCWKQGNDRTSGFTHRSDKRKRY